VNDAAGPPPVMRWRAAARAISSQWLSVAVVGLAALASHILLARLLGLEQYGIFAAVTAAATILSVVQTGGYRQLILRESVAKSAGLAEPVILRQQSRGHVLAVTIVVCVATVLLAPWIAVALPAAVAIAANAPRIIANLVSAELLAQSRYVDDARWQMFTRTIPIVIGAVAALLGASTMGVLVVLLLAQCLVLLRLPNGLQHTTARFDPGQMPLRAIRDIVLIDLLTQAYTRLPVLFLYSTQMPLEEVGRFGLLQKMIEAYGTLLAPLAVIYGNRVRREGAESRHSRRLLSMIVAGASALVLAFIVLNATVGSLILTAALGPSFGQSVTTAGWMLAAALFMAPNLLMGQALLSENRERRFVAAVGATVVVGMAASALLVPLGGALGAAKALLVTEFALFVALVVVQNRKVMPGLANRQTP
jgi:O-antigen/teichoic acid export membrane protein